MSVGLYKTLSGVYNIIKVYVNRHHKFGEGYLKIGGDWILDKSLVLAMILIVVSFDILKYRTSIETKFRFDYVD